MHLTSTILSSSLLLIFALLLYPLLTTLNASPVHKEWALTHVKTAVKAAFLVSLLPLFIFLNSGAETIVTAWQ